MNTLKTLTLIGAASVLALSATAASAQPYDGRYVERAYDGQYRDRAYDGRGYDDRRDGQRYGQRNGASISQRLARVDNRIDRGLQRGDLSRREAFNARNQYRQIAHRLEMYRPGGYNRMELADLDNRLDRLEAQVRFDRHDNEYGYGYGRRDGYENRR